MNGAGDILPTTWRSTYHVTAGLVPDRGNATFSEVDRNSTATTGAADMVAVHWGALALGLIVLATALGNVLLILAVVTEHSLQNMTNYFLASLAAADLLVAVIVMPLAVVVQLYDGYFPLGSTLCIVWATMDVLMCTASIWHMATISVDRYCSLRYPLRYRRTKTTMFVVAKIAFVWVASVGICSTLAIAGFVSTRNVYHDGHCSPVVPEFVIYGSIFAFYVPLIVMFVTYALTVRALSVNARSLASLWKHQVSAEQRPDLLLREVDVKSTGITSRVPDFALSSSSSGGSSSEDEGDAATPATQTPHDDADGERHDRTTPLRPPTATLDQSVTRNGGLPPHRVNGQSYSRADELRDKLMHSTPALPVLLVALQNHQVDRRRLSISTPSLAASCSATSETKMNNGTDDGCRSRTRCDSDVFPVSHKPKASAHTRRDVRGAVSSPRSNHVAALRRQTSTPAEQTAADSDASGSVATRRKVATSTSARRRRLGSSHRSGVIGRSADSKRKATRVLGVMFVVFVVFWTPFFVLNVLSAACPQCVEFASPSVWTVLVWLGWISSLANPIIYTSFSPAFRSAFCRLMTCASSRTVPLAKLRQQQWTSHLRRRRHDTA